VQNIAITYDNMRGLLHMCFENQNTSHASERLLMLILASDGQLTKK